MRYDTHRAAHRRKTGKQTMASKQGDLFNLYSPLKQEIVGDRSIMAYPFFGLDRKPSMTPLTYETDKVKIEVNPSTNGVATIYDKEIILYVASLIAQRVSNGEEASQEFQFTAHDFFNATNTNLSANSYKRVDKALARLQGTQIRTNIETGGEGEVGYFSWLSEARLQYTKSKIGGKRLKTVKVRLCDWLYRAIVNNIEFLKYAEEYFGLGPVERRLYEVAQVACADAATLEIDVADLHHQVGYKSPLHRFKIELKRISNGNCIPDYTMTLSPAPEPQQTGRGRRSRCDRVTIAPRITQA